MEKDKKIKNKIEVITTHCPDLETRRIDGGAKKDYVKTKEGKNVPVWRLPEIYG